MRVAIRALARAVGLVLVASVVGRAPVGAQTESGRTVLTIHSGAENYPANPLLDAGIREGMDVGPGGPIAYFTEYLESDRFEKEDATLALADYIARKYRGRRIDVVIAMTNTSLQFVLDHRARLFPDVPVVFAGLNVPPAAIPAPGPGIAAVRVGVSYAETLKLALDLHPSSERVFIVAKSRNKASVDFARGAFTEFSQRVALTYVAEESVPRLLARIKAVPPRSLILYLWHQELAGDGMSSAEIARLVAAAAPVPVYGVIDINIGTGIVGGMVRGTRETGVRVGALARRILDGTRPQDIPVEAARLVPTFDWRQLRRWGIDPSRLPPGSDVQFRTPTAWESYRGYIVAAVAIVAAQLLLITALLTQRARRRRAEETIRTREATLRTSYDRIRQLAGRLINAQEAARADLARDLHDGVCQELASVAFGVGTLKGSSGRVQDSHTQDALSKLERETLDALADMRRLSHDLHPATLRLLGLAAALRGHCNEVAKRHGVRVSFEAQNLGCVSPELAVCLFRIAQESLRNGIEHGGARQLAVSLARTGDRIELTVTDDGTGFDLEAVGRNGGGLGLVSIEERAHAIGGDVQIVTAPGQGTMVRVRGAADAGAEARPST